MILADTGFWVALANIRDKFHQLSIEALSQTNEELITTWPVLTETCHLLLTRGTHGSANKFLKGQIKGAFRIYPLDESHTPRIVKLMDKYASLPMDLADASLVILAEEIGEGRIFSTDQRDFKSYRWKNHKPFRNLLLPS